MDFERAESRREDFYVRTYVSSKRRSLEGCNFFQRELSTVSSGKRFFYWIIIRLYLDFASEKAGREYEKY